MAFNTVRSVRSAFVAFLCIAMVLCIKAEEASSDMELMERRLVRPTYRPPFQWDSPSTTSRPLFDWSSREVKDECNCTCGVSHHTRIVGGSLAGRAEFPWLVSMLKRGISYCGGSLITERHVLTAAHCVEKIKFPDVTIALGAYNVYNTTEKFLTRSIKSATMHPNYKYTITGSDDSDIAVIELDRPVTFGKWNIGTACLPSETYREYRGEYATVVGRGRTREGGPRSGIPLKVDVPLMTMQDCRDTDYDPADITDNMLCAGFLEGKIDACTGDSGGPLNFRTSNTNFTSMELIGVVSFGEGCARPNLPGVYVRVQKFVSWIRAQIAGACECTRA